MHHQKDSLQNQIKGGEPYGTSNSVQAAKKCPKCERDLPADAFYPTPSKLNGLSGWCKECHRDQGRKKRPKPGQQRRARRRTKWNIPELVKRFETEGPAAVGEFCREELLNIIRTTSRDSVRLQALALYAKFMGDQEQESKDNRTLIQAVLKAKREKESEQEQKDN